MIDVMYGIIGLLLLTSGRRLFWLFVACMGFTVGLQLAPHYLGTQPSWAYWVVALLFGGIGAIIAVFFQIVAIGLAGFAAGSTISIYLATMMGFSAVGIFALLGGLVGAIILYLVFGWALIVLSAVVGATFIVQVLNLNIPATTVFYVVLIAAGIWFQASLQRRPNPNPK